jgi:hypothetical protein
VRKLQRFWHALLVQVTNDIETRPWLFPIRVDTDNLFYRMTARLYFKSILRNDDTAGVLVFCRSIIGVRNTFDYFLMVVTAALTRATRDANEAGGLRERAADLLRQLTEARAGRRVPDFIETGWRHVQQPNQTPAESFAMEPRRAYVGLVIAIYYHWRDIGAEYSQKMFRELKVHRVHMISSPSKLALGVSLPGIRHTAVMTPPDDVWTLAQMLVRRLAGASASPYFSGSTRPTWRQWSWRLTRSPRRA